MIVRQKTERISDWKGLNTIDNKEDVGIDTWIDSMNCIVGPSGSATALRSPLDWSPTFASGDPIIGIHRWSRSAGDLVMVDTWGAGNNLTTYTTDGTTNTSVRNKTGAGYTTQTSHPPVHLSVLDRDYMIDGTEFGQFEPAASTRYLVGITEPSVAPTASIVAGGSVTYATGVTVSYAYYNSTTGHVSYPSTASGSSGAAAGQTLRVAVTASSQTGVDKIVLFITQDGGSVRFLQVDSSGAIVTYSNSTGNINITTQPILDTNTTEPLANKRPPDTATYMWLWKDRVWLAGFPSAGMKGQVIYSALETVSVGVQYESYPYSSALGLWLNAVNVPGRGEQVMGGVGTDVGNMILTDRNAYLITGEPTDKIVTPYNAPSVTERIDSLNWGIGTWSPRTIQNTPHGIIFLDNTRRIQLWPLQGKPIEIGRPLRAKLADLTTRTDDTGTEGLRAVHARYFQQGEMSYYVLCGKTPNNSNPYRHYIIGIQSMEDGSIRTTYGIAETTAPSGAVGVVTDTKSVNKNSILVVPSVTASYKLQSWFDLATAGSGWATAASQPYFSVMTGNTNVNFTHLHTIRYDCNVADITVQASDPEETDIEPVQTVIDNNSKFAVINRYGVRQRLKFLFPKDDSQRREIYNLTVLYSGKTRPS